eukprot:1149475-Pelagomonas_calceolata.AAC.2
MPAHVPMRPVLKNTCKCNERLDVCVCVKCKNALGASSNLCHICLVDLGSEAEREGAGEDGHQRVPQVPDLQGWQHAQLQVSVSSELPERKKKGEERLRKKLLAVTCTC